MLINLSVQSSTNSNRPSYNRAPNNVDRPQVGNEQSNTPNAHSPIGNSGGHRSPTYERAPDNVNRPSVGKEQDNAPTAHEPIGGTTKRPEKGVLVVTQKDASTGNHQQRKKPIVLRKMDQTEMLINLEMVRLIDNRHPAKSPIVQRKDVPIETQKGESIGNHRRKKKAIAQRKGVHHGIQRHRIHPIETLIERVRIQNPVEDVPHKLYLPVSLSNEMHTMAGSIPVHVGPPKRSLEQMKWVLGALV